MTRATSPLRSGSGADYHGSATHGPGPLLLSLSKAAKELGVSKHSILRLADEGKILAVECGDQTKYNRASIEAYAAGNVPHVVMSQRRNTAMHSAAARNKVLSKQTAA